MRFSGMTGAPLSRGRPIPSKTLPSISSLTPSSMLLPKNLALAVEICNPEDPSKSCTSALSPLISRTLPFLLSPSDCSISTSSSYLTPSTPSTSIRGPTTSLIVLYSFSILSSYPMRSEISFRISLSISSNFSSTFFSSIYFALPICSRTGISTRSSMSTPFSNAS